MSVNAHESTNVPSLYRMLQKSTVLLLLLCVVTAGFAVDFHKYSPLTPRQISVLMPTETRTVIDLSGTWDVVEDGQPSGTVAVPGTVSGTGPITLRKTINLKAETVKRFSWQLEFFGISDEIQVRINQKELVRHPGGNAPFTVVITDRMLQSGSNQIELVIGPTGSLITSIRRYAPSSPKQWTGVTRELFLVGTPHVSTAEVRTSTSYSQNFSSASLLVTTSIRGANVERISNPTDTAKSIQQGIVDIDVETIVRNKQTGDVVSRDYRSNLKVERARTVVMNADLHIANPQLWSPEQPNLYEIEVRSLFAGRVIDVYKKLIGLRSISVAGAPAQRQIRLNGRPFFVYGVSYVDEYPQVGPSMSWRQMENDVTLLKTLGANTVRAVRGCLHPYFMYLCDVYGIMVMPEIDASGIPTPLLQHDEVKAYLENHADLLATYVSSHPSVLACGLSTGFEEGSPIVLAYHKTVAALFRKHISVPLYKVVPSTQISKLNEGGFDFVVLSANSRSEQNSLQTAFASAKNSVRSAALLSLVGFPVSPQNSNGYSDPISLESQAVAIRDGLTAARTNALAGIIINTFADYSLELPTLMVDGNNHYICTAGLLDAWRQPRVGFDMYKALINDEKEPLLQARNFTDSTSSLFLGTGIVLALILMLMVNRSRRFREYFIRSLVRPYNFYADIRDQRILSIKQTAGLGIVIAAGSSLILASTLYYLRTDARMEYLMHLFISDGILFSIVRWVAWNPLLAIITGTVFCLGLLAATAGLLRAAAIFSQGRILFRDSFTIVVWGAVPLLMLTPIGMGLYELLASDTISMWIPLLIVSVMLWSLFRILRSTAVVYNVSSLAVHGIGLGFITLLLIALITVWELQFDILEFLDYFRSVMVL